MKSEEEITTRTIERTATVRLLRVVDLDKIIADASDGSVTVDDLQKAGDFVVEVQPNGRNVEAKRIYVADHSAGLAWLAGFETCAELKKKGTRKPNGSGSPWARKSKPELLAACAKAKINPKKIEAAKNKGELIALLEVATKK